MSNDTSKQQSEKIGAKPHTWKHAVDCIGLEHLDDQHIEMVCKSGIPGADTLMTDGKWVTEDQIKFLKTFCGENT